jgi:hypothetical protein
MKQVECSECRQLSPISDTLLVKRQHVCSSCVEGVLSQAVSRGIAKTDVVRAADPTVCTQCKADNGHEDFPRVAGLSVCPECEDKFRNRPYPTWLKLSFVGLVCLAIFSFVWNWRFVAALRETRQMSRALDAGNFERAANLAESAARRVPEAPELAAFAQFSRGLDFLSKEQAAKGLECLKKAKQSPASKQLAELDLLILQAEANLAFEEKRYDDCLAKTKVIAARQPGDPISAAKLASAYACKYAVTGSEEFRQEALKNLARAEKLTVTKEEKAGLAEYRPRILHRLETREIISPSEFHRRFPNGYEPKTKT